MILLKFATEIKGTSKIAKHENWIELDSLQFGVGRAISNVGGSADRETSNPSFSEITCSKSTDKASPELFMQAIGGKSLGKAEFHFLNTGGIDKKEQVYLTIEVEGAMLSSYSASSGGDRPTESFSINFTKISYKYDTFTGDKIETGTAKKWDLQKNAIY